MCSAVFYPPLQNLESMACILTPLTLFHWFSPQSDYSVMSFIAQASTFPGVMCERFTGDTRVVEGSNSAHSDAHPYYERFLIAPEAYEGHHKSVSLIARWAGVNPAGPAAPFQLFIKSSRSKFAEDFLFNYFLSK